MIRNKAVRAVLAGASITDAAREHGVSRVTLHRWLRAFDADRPIASLRPEKRGPKAPRWDAEVFDTVVALINDHPDWWGKRRVAAALADRGLVVSESTVSRILPLARERIAQTCDRDVRAAQAKRSREVAAMARRDARDIERREMWRRWLMPGSVEGLTVEERFYRFAEALSGKGWRMQVKDLTPELEELADIFVDYFRRSYSGITGPREDWMLEMGWRIPDLKALLSRPALDINHVRVGVLNYLVRAYRDGALLPPPPRRLPAPDMSA